MIMYVDKQCSLDPSNAVYAMHTISVKEIVDERVLTIVIWYLQYTLKAIRTITHRLCVLGDDSIDDDEHDDSIDDDDDHDDSIDDDEHDDSIDDDELDDSIDDDDDHDDSIDDDNDDYDDFVN